MGWFDFRGTIRGETGKQTCIISVRGKRNTYSFKTYVDVEHLEEWREDGIEIDRLIYTIPEWCMRLKISKVVVFLQDIWNFRNPL